MASPKAFSRLSSRLQRFSFRQKKPVVSPSPLHSQGPPSKRITSAIYRLPMELRCLGSLMPLHSAIAAARLRSNLAVESQNWGLVPQGISMPL